MSISNLSNHCLRNHLLSLVMALFWLFVPPIIWMYSTRYVFWNYHLYKYGSLILLALNDLIIIQKFIMSSFYPSLIHFLSIIPVGEYIGKDMIMQLGVFLFAGLPPLIPIYIGCKLYGTFSSDLVLDEIDRFKLDQYIDFRKSKEFAYDFKAVRYLSTGSQFVVKELDRFCICTVTVQPAPQKHPVCSRLPLRTTLIRKYITRIIRKKPATKP